MTIRGNERFQRRLEYRANRQSGFRILVVDDEPSILELVKTALETLENYQVSIASNATDGLDIVKVAEKPFDCVLLDIQMPDIDGIEMLCELRELPEYVDTPILMLTAMSDRKYIDEAFLEGATDYVNKPFDFLELHSRIKCAHSMVELRRKNEKSLQCASDLKRKLRSMQHFSFEDPFSINGLGRFLRYVEFDNYVAQLGRVKLFGSQVASVMVRDADLFFHHVGCESFRDAIEDVASIIEDATSDLDCVFSYRGNGVFMAISHGRKASVSAPGTVNLSELIEARLVQHVTDPRLEVLVGEPISMSPFSPSGASGAVQKSLTAVQRLEGELQKKGSSKSFAVDCQESKQDKSHLRVYERTLQELFGGNSYRNVQ